METAQDLFLTYTPETLPPAQLWIGNHDTTVKAIEKFLQQILCKNKSCSTCTTCMQIREKQHHSVLWLYPEKNYTIDQLEDLFNTLSFQLQHNEHFFFIIHKADFLPATCANKLLKPMEEPPRGYHFILLAEHTEQILPTILSRCITYRLDHMATNISSTKLYECFTTKMVAASQFSKIIDATTIHERESIELLNQILRYWINQYIMQHATCPDNDQATIFAIITQLKKAHQQPPMPGSNITFWHNLYLQLQNHLKFIKVANA